MPKPAVKGVASKLKSPIPKQRTGPLWTGPFGEGPLGGVTQSMLGKFLVCRERFRLRYIVGLKPTEGFSKTLEYGQLWHACEESTAAGIEWQVGLEKYKDQLMKKYPLQREEVGKWYMACKMQYPIYLDYWSRHKDVIDRTPLMQEQVFDVPYTLPSGRVVRLRGKFDSVDLIGKGKNAGVWLQENKTKGSIDEALMRKQLKFDLQTMMYLTALHADPFSGYESEGHFASDFPKHPIKGVRYNVIGRPFSGKGNIKPRQATKNQPAETPEEYWDRLQQYFILNPEEWFMRWEANISPEEVKGFQRKCLNPLLEMLCDWYDCLEQCSGDDFEYCQRHKSTHFQFPFGVYSPLTDGGETEYDVMLDTGSDAGLKRTDELFTELQ